MRSRVSARTAIIAAIAAIFSACSRAPRPTPLTVTEVREFVIPWDEAFPSDVAVDRDGLLWFTDRLRHRIGSFDVRTGTFKSYATPTPKSAPYGMAVAPDGMIWIAASRTGKLIRLDPRTARMQEFAIPGAMGGPHHLAVAKGRIWFSLREARAYGWFDPRTGESAIVGTPFMQPYSLAVAGDTMVWMSAFDRGMLLHVDARTLAADTMAFPSPQLPPNVHVRTDMPVRARISNPIRRLAADGSGRLWMTSFLGGDLVTYEPRDATMSRVAGTRGAAPYGITVDAAGRIWFYESGQSMVVALDPATGVRHEWRPATKRGTVRSIVVDGKRGRVWLPLSDKGRIGLITIPPIK